MNELKIDNNNVGLLDYMADTEDGFDFRLVDNIVFISNNGFAVNPNSIKVEPYKKSMTIRFKDKIKLIDSRNTMLDVIKKTIDNGISIWQGGFNPPWKDIVDEYSLFSPFILVSIDKLDFSKMVIQEGGPDSNLSRLRIPLVFENTPLLRVVLLGEEGKKFWEFVKEG